MPTCARDLRCTPPSSRWGHLLALHITAADERGRAHMGVMAEVAQQITGERVELAFVDQGYTSENAVQAVDEH